MPAICIIGEAWGQEEERERTAFVGTTGYILTKMLEEAGIRRADCFLTNVFNLRPRNNEIEDLCGPKGEGIYGYPALTKSKYVRNEFQDELLRLQQELLEVNPNIIICTGNTPMWALSGVTGISKRRGTIWESTHCVSGFKCLGTYHPSAIMRQWELRAVTVLDLAKAERESAFPEIVRPQREIWIEPELEDMEEFYERYIRNCTRLSVDIETAGTQITCIGFAPNERIALVVPFTDPRRARGSYWPTKQSELDAWAYVRKVLQHPSGKVFQNGLYDISFLWRSYELKVRNPEHDSMLLHHALQPESPKGLDFLGSVYTNEAAWKLMRPRGKQTIKRDE